MTNITGLNQSLFTLENQIQHLETIQTVTAFNQGLESALSYLGNIIYIAPILLLTYIILDKVNINKALDVVYLKHHNIFKPTTLRNAIKEACVFSSFMATSWVLILFLKGSNIIGVSVV